MEALINLTGFMFLTIGVIYLSYRWSRPTEEEEKQFNKNWDEYHNKKH